MKHNLFACAATAILITAPGFAQRGGGLGLGHAAGGVTGAATGTLNGPVNSTVHGAASEVGSANVGREPGGHGLGAQAVDSLNATQSAALSSHLEPLLPAGMPLSAASAGFRNEGQFIAAVHVAHNLNIPFDQLKAAMTGPKAMSLGKAIQTLRPDLDGKTVKENLKLADRQTERDLSQIQSGGKQDRWVARLNSDSRMTARLTALLPSGMTLDQAAAGFKNEGQFIAALHVSKNLGIPFTELKDRVTAGESLGAAIHALKPDVDEKAAETAAATAEAQAKDDRVEASASASASAGGSAGVK
jgi:hypothetical protein